MRRGNGKALGRQKVVEEEKWVGVVGESYTGGGWSGERRLERREAVEGGVELSLQFRNKCVFKRAQKLWIIWAFLFFEWKFEVIWPSNDTSYASKCVRLNISMSGDVVDY